MKKSVFKDELERALETNDQWFQVPFDELIGETSSGPYNGYKAYKDGF